MCGTLTAIAWCWPSTVLSVLFGPAFAGGAGPLGPYALATSLSVASIVVVTYRLSLGHAGSSYLTLAAGIIQLAVLILLHDTVAMVVQIQIAVAAGLLVATLAEAWLGSASSISRQPAGAVVEPD